VFLTVCLTTIAVHICDCFPFHGICPHLPAPGPACHGVTIPSPGAAPAHPHHLPRAPVLLSGCRAFRSRLGVPHTAPGLPSLHPAHPAPLHPAALLHTAACLPLVHKLTLRFGAPHRQTHLQLHLHFTDLHFGCAHFLTPSPITLGVIKQFLPGFHLPHGPFCRMPRLHCCCYGMDPLRCLRHAVSIAIPVSTFWTSPDGLPKFAPLSIRLQHAGVVYTPTPASTHAARTYAAGTQATNLTLAVATGWVTWFLHSLTFHFNSHSLVCQNDAKRPDTMPSDRWTVAFRHGQTRTTLHLALCLATRSRRHDLPCRRCARLLRTTSGHPLLPFTPLPCAALVPSLPPPLYLTHPAHFYTLARIGVLGALSANTRFYTHLCRAPRTTLALYTHLRAPPPLHLPTCHATARLCRCHCRHTPPALSALLPVSLPTPLTNISRGTTLLAVSSRRTVAAADNSRDGFVRYWVGHPTPTPPSHHTTPLNLSAFTLRIILHTLHAT